MLKVPSFPLGRRRLDPLAAAWLASGATGFGLWCGEQALEYWPREAVAAMPDVSAPLAGGFRIGVVGAGVPALARLEADAALLGDMAAGETDLEAMTAELVNRQDELLAIYELIRSTRSQLDLPLTLGTLARQMTRLLKASLGFAMVTTTDGQHLLAATPPGWIDGNTVRAILTDVQSGKALDFELPAKTFAGKSTGRPRQVLALPVSVGKAVAGIGVGREGNPFAAPEVKLAQAIAEQAGAYIENALFYHESVQQVRLESEMRMAAEVQRHLLPRSWPAIPGVDLHASAKPASVVGGDFYDIVPLDGDRLFVALGDVTGKGAASALVMSMTRAALRSAVRGRADVDPVAVLRHAIASLYEDFDALEMYVTTFLGFYDHATRAVRLVSAGHSPIIHRPSGGPSTLLVPEEPPLGMLATVTAEAQSFPLGPGDLLVVATDGFNEARDPDGAQFGTDRLQAIVDETCGQPAAAIAAALSNAVREFQRGRSPDDDQTLLVLKGV